VNDVATLPLFVKSVVDTSIDAAVVVGARLEVLHCNRQYLRLANLSHRDLRDEQRELCHTRLGMELCAVDGCLARRAMETARPIRMDEVSNKTMDLRVIWQAIPLLNDAGEPYACLEVYRDVTAESRMQSNYKVLLEKERRRAELLQEEVQRRTADLQRANDALNRALQQVSTLARTDPLTTLFNRRVFDEQLSKELARALRFKRELGLLLFDLDHFKSVNDRHGHQAGDEALRTLARILSEAVRTVDTAARIGGEEFAIILPETALADALAVAERLRAAQESSGRYTTVSIGVASAPQHGATPESLFKSADAALYRAKDGGRNRVAVAE
jgi:diguanylate cyclase (GGDEF)-like protein